MKIGFLFNHDALHQVRHSAPIIGALVPDARAEVTVLTSSAAQETEVRAIIGAQAAAAVHFERLSIGRTARLLDAALRWIAPFRRIAVLMPFSGGSDMAFWQGIRASLATPRIPDP